MRSDDTTEYRAAGRTWTHPLPIFLAWSAFALALATGHDAATAWLNWAIYLIIGRVALGVARLVGFAERPTRKGFINHPATQVAGVVGATIGYTNTRDVRGLVLGGALWTVGGTVVVAVALLIMANVRRRDGRDAR